MTHNKVYQPCMNRFLYWTPCT